MLGAVRESGDLLVEKATNGEVKVSEKAGLSRLDSREISDGLGTGFPNLFGRLQIHSPADPVGVGHPTPRRNRRGFVGGGFRQRGHLAFKRRKTRHEPDLDRQEHRSPVCGVEVARGGGRVVGVRGRPFRPAVKKREGRNPYPVKPVPH